MNRLVLVPTPIGNLKDITLRSIEVLENSDLILAEDTRVSGKLLNHLNISKPMFSFHAHNEHKALQSVIAKIKTCSLVSLVTDAGTPGISDPGFLLVRECIKEGIEVECLGGPTAFVPALVVSGLPCDRFVFEGFLPQKKGRQTRVQEIAERKLTTVLYESPYRIVKCLKQFMEFCGEDRQVSVSREISKMFEENFRGTLKEAHDHFDSKTPKGEFVVVLAPKEG